MPAVAAAATTAAMIAVRTWLPPRLRSRESCGAEARFSAA
jgi:hypothetical protein